MDYRLEQRQSLPLEMKIIMSQRRIREWHDYWNGQVYISFSGGKDSTVLLHLARDVYPKMPAVFSDTGLEFPEIRSFVESVDNVEWIKPKMTFKAVIEKYGYPFPTKEQALYIREYRNTKSDYLKQLRWEGKPQKSDPKKKSGNISKKWRVLCDAPFEVSEKCCDALKKSPFKIYEKKSGNYPYVGSQAAESSFRRQQWERHGCNAFETNRPISTPLSFWMEEDIWAYLKENEIPYCEIYDKGWDRTGCMFCMFGVHLEKEPNRFQKMKNTHPAQYKYCIEKLGIGDVLDYVNVPY